MHCSPAYTWLSADEGLTHPVQPVGGHFSSAHISHDRSNSPESKCMRIEAVC